MEEKEEHLEMAHGLQFVNDVFRWKTGNGRQEGKQKLKHEMQKVNYHRTWLWDDEGDEAIIGEGHLCIVYSAAGEKQ